MPWFRVGVHGPDLAAANDKLRASEITLKVEQVYAGFVDAGPPHLKVVAAVVEMDDADAAKKRVQDIVGDSYELEARELARSSKSSRND